MKFESPKEALDWAKKHGPSDESRKAVLSSIKYAYWYAKDVDGSPRDDTRKAVLSDPEWAYWYAYDVDESPRDDTRKAVLSSSEWTYWYTKDVDGGVIHPDVAKAMRPLLLAGDRQAIKLFKKFGDKT